VSALLREAGAETLEERGLVDVEPATFSCMPSVGNLNLTFGVANDHDGA
jgi:hypothetical protein